MRDERARGRGAGLRAARDRGRGAARRGAWVARRARRRRGAGSLERCDEGELGRRPQHLARRSSTPTSRRSRESLEQGREDGDRAASSARKEAYELARRGRPEPAARTGYGSAELRRQPRSPRSGSRSLAGAGARSSSSGWWSSRDGALRLRRAADDGRRRRARAAPRRRRAPPGRQEHRDRLEGAARRLSGAFAAEVDATRRDRPRCRARPPGARPRLKLGQKAYWRAVRRRPRSSRDVPPGRVVPRRGEEHDPTLVELRGGQRRHHRVADEPDRDAAAIRVGWQQETIAEQRAGRSRISVASCYKRLATMADAPREGRTVAGHRRTVRSTRRSGRSNARCCHGAPSSNSTAQGLAAARAHADRACRRGSSRRPSSWASGEQAEVLPGEAHAA